MKRHLFLLSALAVTLLAAPATAAPDDHAPKLLALLRGIDTIPTARQLSAVTAEPRAALLQAALDPALSRYERRRATSLLSTFPDATSEAYLSVVTTMVGDPAVRWMAIYTYLRTFGPAHPERAVQLAEHLLRSPVPLVREAAVRGLRFVRGQPATTLLARHGATETDKLVRAALRRVTTVRARVPANR